MNKHIQQAIKSAGNQALLADKLGVHQSFISLMLSGRKSVPATLCMRIEAITKGEVKAVQIRPDVFKEVTM